MFRDPLSLSVVFFLPPRYKMQANRAQVTKIWRFIINEKDRDLFHNANIIIIITPTFHTSMTDIDGNFFSSFIFSFPPIQQLITSCALLKAGSATALTLPVNKT